MFPEGTRQGLVKQVKLKNGAVFMALRAGVPIIPVGIRISYNPLVRAKINYGKPIDLSEHYSKKPEKEIMDKITKEVMKRIIELTNEVN